MNFKQLLEAIEPICRSNLTPLIIGDFGSGKTQGVAQFAEMQDAKYVNFRLGNMADAGDLLGLSKITDKGTIFVPPSWFPQSGKGVLFLDEINRARKDLLQCTFQLTLDKRIHDHVLPKAVFDENGKWVDGWIVIAAMNPPNDNYIVTDMADDAFSSRFCYINFKPTVSEWLEYARGRGVQQSIISFIENNPTMLRKQNSEYDFKFLAPSQRSWEELDRITKHELDEDLLIEIATGIVGPVAALQYRSFRDENFKRLKAAELFKSGMTKKNKEKLEKYEKERRVDIITSINTEIKELTDQRKLTTKELDVLVEYLMIIPKEAAVSLITQMGSSSKTDEDKLYILNHLSTPELMKRFKIEEEKNVNSA